MQGATQCASLWDCAGLWASLQRTQTLHVDEVFQGETEAFDKSCRLTASAASQMLALAWLSLEQGYFC